jgi:hypothetical protein
LFLWDLERVRGLTVTGHLDGEILCPQTRVVKVEFDLFTLGCVMMVSLKLWMGDF